MAGVWQTGERKKSEGGGIADKILESFPIKEKLRRPGLWAGRGGGGGHLEPFMTQFTRELGLVGAEKKG